MLTITNENRAMRGRNTLEFYIEHQAQGEVDLSNQDAVQSEVACLLADLMHLCDEEKADFNRALQLAHDHHTEEVEEEK